MTEKLSVPAIVGKGAEMTHVEIIVAHHEVGLSVVGKLWATKGAKCFPADEAITFEAYTSKPASQKRATEKVTGTEIFLSTMNSILLLTVQDTNIL